MQDDSFCIFKYQAWMIMWTFLIEYNHLVNCAYILKYCNKDIAMHESMFIKMCFIKFCGSPGNRDNSIIFS